MQKIIFLLSLVGIVVLAELIVMGKLNVKYAPGPLWKKIALNVLFKISGTIILFAGLYKGIDWFLLVVTTGVIIFETIIMRVASINYSDDPSWKWAIINLLFKATGALIAWVAWLLIQTI